MMLLFDISGFFDNINHRRLVSVSRSLGFPLELVSWLESFLTDRHVSLKFNDFTSDPYDLLVGTPQGSPISPVLSIIFASPLLYLAQRWTNTSLSMYVDDGNLFACGTDFDEVTARLRHAYLDCWNWLNRAGLAIEPDKPEVIFFTNSHTAHRPTRIWLADPSRALEYQVEASNTVRYLGIFFGHKLNWHDHVRIMTNRARSLNALQLLGNSIRGLSWTQWRTVFNAIVLPILTYAAPVWYTGQAALLRELRAAQLRMLPSGTSLELSAPRRSTPYTNSWASCPSTSASECWSKMPLSASIVFHKTLNSSLESQAPGAD
jgi:hypothetical protein